jgi:peptide/nickel transport system substrate-binding protein
MRYRLNRRDFFRLAAMPALSGAARAGGTEKSPGKSVTFVPQAMPVSLDPIATPSFATRTASMAVFETLYGTDADLNPMPQMVSGHRTEDEGKRWIFQLRPGLLFHDGTRVTAADCVASLRRWMARDRVGRALAARLEAIEATTEETLTLRLTRPLLGVPLMLTKSQLSPPVIMPARLAATSPFTPVAEIVGSGPFRLPNLSWHPGENLDLLRFTQYQPRPEASSFTGGGRVALLDRVSWRTQDDPVRALRDGAVDWVEMLPPNLVDEMLEAPGLAVARLDDVGYYALLRLNTRRGPTANPAIRRAILAGIDPTAVMQTVFGTGTGRFATPLGLFPPASLYASTAGMDNLGATLSPRAIKARLKDAGYKGESIVILNPVDDMIATRLTGAVIDELTQIGLTVEERKLDHQAFATWRRHAGADAADDWSALCDSLPAADQFDGFAVSAGPGPSRPGGGVSGGGTSGGGTGRGGASGDGTSQVGASGAATSKADASGEAAFGDIWPGWPDDDGAGHARDAWIDATDARVRAALAASIQTRVFTTAAFVPLGQWFPMTAWRASMTGPRRGCFPVFWDVARA